MHANFAVFQGEEYFSLIYEDEGLWCFKVLYYIDFLCEHVNDFERLVFVFDENLFIV